jgi:hypothetical protein
MGHGYAVTKAFSVLSSRCSVTFPLLSPASASGFMHYCSLATAVAQLLLRLSDRPCSCKAVETCSGCVRLAATEIPRLS